MARRRRVAMCEDCGGSPVRRGGRRWCAVCYADMKRPKRTCSVCSVEYAADMLTGKRCRACVSNLAHSKRIVETYGLSADDYKELLVFQGGVCWICLRHPRSKRLAVDHDHKTGAVRGLLCRGCNRDVLGHLREDQGAFLRASSYLDEPPARRLWPDRDVTP